MKIYIASSWKNEERLLAIAKTLRKLGHEVDCFCDGSQGRFTFSYSQIDGDASKIDPINFMFQPLVKKAFEEDKKWIDWADVVILVLPSGKSAHLEAGYAAGKNKIVFALGDFKPGEFEVMYGFIDGMFRNFDDLVDQLNLEAYGEGYIAGMNFIHKLESKPCPYPELSNAYHEWEIGFDKATEDERRFINELEGNTQGQIELRIEEAKFRTESMRFHGR